MDGHRVCHPHTAESRGRGASSHGALTRAPMPPTRAPPQDMSPSKGPHLQIPPPLGAGFQHRDLAGTQMDTFSPLAILNFKPVLQGRYSRIRQGAPKFAVRTYSLHSTEWGLPSVLLFSKLKAVTTMFPKAPHLMIPRVCHSGICSNSELDRAQGPSLLPSFRNLYKPWIRTQGPSLLRSWELLLGIHDLCFLVCIIYFNKEWAWSLPIM